jgi:precorrin-3B C17-methyltransferase
MRKGKIYTIGIGHSPEHITKEIIKILKNVDLVAGFGGFIDMVKEYIPEHVKMIDDHATRSLASDFIEAQQKRVASIVLQALEGKTIAVLSGGDSGIWGTAAFFIEAQSAHDNAFDVEVIPGICGFIACAARVGAPLMNGFCLVAIGDEDTPFPIVEKKLKGAAMSGMPLVLYKVLLESANAPEYYPEEKYPALYPPLIRTEERLNKTYEILSNYIGPKTPMAIITDVYNQVSVHKEYIPLLGSDTGTEVIDITTFDQFLEKKGSYRFFTSIIIGEDITKVWNNHMYTPQWNYNWTYTSSLISKVKDINTVKEIER